MKDNVKIFKKTIYLAVPMMIQNGISNAVGLVDNIMVGSLGTEAITAVSIVGQLFFVFFLAIFGGISGPGIYTAQYYGYGDTEGVKRTFRLKIWVAAFCILMGAIVFLGFGENLILLYLKGGSETIDADLTLSIAKRYLDIMLIGGVPMALSQVYASNLRETGDSIKPMVAGIATVITDVVFNYILIFGKFGAPALGADGAAIATSLSRFVELFVLVIWSHIKVKDHPFLEGIYKTLLVPKNVFVPIVKKGFPIFLNEFLWAGGVATLTQCYSLRGLDVVAGLNISNAICNLLNVVFVTLGGAVGIVIGQMLGAEEYEKAKSSSISLMWFAGAISCVVMVILWIMAPFFPKIYNTTPEVKTYATWFIVITAAGFPIQGFLNALYFTLRSGGKTIITFLFDSGFSWVVCVPLATILVNFTGFNVLIVYASIQLAEVIKLIVGYTLIKKGVWITNLVAGESA